MVCVAFYVCLLLQWTGEEWWAEWGCEHLSVAEPWPPFSSDWELELVDRVSAGSDRHSPIGVATAKTSSTSCWIQLSHAQNSISNSNCCISETEASESYCAYLYTQTLMLFFRSSWMIGRTVEALSVQRVKTSLKIKMYKFVKYISTRQGLKITFNLYLF